MVALVAVRAIAPAERAVAPFGKAATAGSGRVTMTGDVPAGVIESRASHDAIGFRSVGPTTYTVGFDPMRNVPTASVPLRGYAATNSGATETNARFAPGPLCQSRRPPDVSTEFVVVPVARTVPVNDCAAAVIFVTLAAPSVPTDRSGRPAAATTDGSTA